MNKENNKSRKKLILIIVAAILLVIIAAFAFVKIEVGAVSADNKDEITVEIKQGSGSYDIINALDEVGLIKNKTAAKIYVRLFAPDNLQANTYVLNKSMDLSKMLDIISSGDFDYILKSTFTIKEGVTYKEVVAAISEAVGLDQSEIISKWSDKAYLTTLIDKYWFLTDEILENGIICPLEGYLYPSTYFVTDKEPTIESVTEQILKVTDDKLSPYKDKIKDTEMSVHQLLTLASIVENEKYFKEDSPKIAGVFMNRLDQGMMLQSDITVLYALDKKTVDVSLTDIAADSKYNTYQHTGLPIGPVSNPDATTIDACINYETNDYLYFFAKEDHTVIYSKTYEEHLAAFDKYGWY